MRRVRTRAVCIFISSYAAICMYFCLVWAINWIDPNTVRRRVYVFTSTDANSGVCVSTAMCAYARRPFVVQRYDDLSFARARPIRCNRLTLHMYARSIAFTNHRIIFIIIKKYNKKSKTKRKKKRKIENSERKRSMKISTEVSTGCASNCSPFGAQFHHVRKCCPSTESIGERKRLTW